MSEIKSACLLSKVSEAANEKSLSEERTVISPKFFKTLPILWFSLKSKSTESAR